MKESLRDETIMELIGQIPVGSIALLGFIVALRFWRKAPGASLWAAGAFAIALVMCGLNISSGGWQGWFGRWYFGSTLRALSYLLLLVAVYAGRTSIARPGDSPESLWHPVLATIRARPGLRNIFLTVFITVFLVVVLLNTITTLLLPDSFVSTTRVKLASMQNPGIQKPSDASKSEAYLIESQFILDRVIKDLGLTDRWGKRYGGGEPFKISEAREFLRAGLEIYPIPETDLIEIRHYSERPNEAAEIANAVADAYQFSYQTSARRSKDAAIDALSVPETAQVRIIDRATPSARPWRPNRPLRIGVGLWIGLWLGIIVGAGSVGIAVKMGKRPTVKTPGRQLSE